MSHDTFLALVLFAFVSSMTPGPNNAMLMASGVNFGLRRTIPHMLGVHVGFFLLMVSVALGLHGILLAAPLLYDVIRWTGAAYLLYLAWRIGTTRASPSNGESTAASPLTFFQATMFQAVNPKAWIVVATAMTTYSTTSDQLGDGTRIIAVMMVFTTISVTTWTMAGVALRRILTNPTALRVFNVTMGLALAMSLYPILKGAA